MKLIITCASKGLRIITSMPRFNSCSKLYDTVEKELNKPVILSMRDSKAVIARESRLDKYFEYGNTAYLTAELVDEDNLEHRTDNHMERRNEAVAHNIEGMANRNEAMERKIEAMESRHEAVEKRLDERIGSTQLFLGFVTVFVFIVSVCHA